MSLFLDAISITSKSIGDIRIQATIEEVYNDEMQITEHPVEKGAPISDHAYKIMPDVTIKAGWSNADYEALTGVNVLSSAIANGSMTKESYIHSIYSQLLALQESATPFDVTTSFRIYENMLFKSLGVTKDVKTGESLMVTATLKQVNIVETKATTLPATENQANPAATAETTNAGTKSAVQTTPAPGGSIVPH